MQYGGLEKERKRKKFFKSKRYNNNLIFRIVCNSLYIGEKYYYSIIRIYIYISVEVKSNKGELIVPLDRVN